MPKRQETFTIVPTTVAKHIVPRPPMTSKAAKKAYREANKVPKISKAEQRRIEAAEIARQKKEYEKERAAAKAKAAREKKLQKEKEEREKRKKQGLPEPSRFVRASQPTIKMFVKTGAGEKRSWEEMDISADENVGVGIDKEEENIFKSPNSNRPRRRRPIGADREDELGTPLASSLECVLKPPEIGGRIPQRTKTTPSPSTRETTTSPNRNFHVISMQHSQQITLLDQDRQVVEPIPIKMASTASQQPAIDRTDAVSHKSARIPLGEIPSNSGLSMLPSWSTPVSSTPEMAADTEGVHAPPGPTSLPLSTQAFIEAHLEDFFPTPSQQARELLEDIDDIPSNTQIGREINAEQDTNAARLHSSIPRAQIEDTALDHLSPRGPAISFPYPRGIDTPSKTFSVPHPPDTLVRTSAPPAPAQRAPKNNPHAITTKKSPDQPKHPCPAQHQPKPRFFEEKEEDLLHAALHESLLMAKPEPPSSSSSSSPRRRSRRILQQAPSARTDYGDDDFSSDMETEFLAVLDRVEEGCRVPPPPPPPLVWSR